MGSISKVKLMHILLHPTLHLFTIFKTGEEVTITPFPVSSRAVRP